MFTAHLRGWNLMLQNCNRARTALEPYGATLTIANEQSNYAAVPEPTCRRGEFLG